jgi:homoserine kinase type II
MAVYTALADADVASLLADYDIGPALAFEGIAEGVENTNYKLTTPTGRFILTIFEKRVAAADLPFFMRVMELLAAKGFAAPRPLATRAGGHLSEVKGKPAAIVSFLDGVWPRVWGTAHCAAVGEALARMHVALEGFDGERRNALSVDGWEALITRRLDKVEMLRPGLAALVERDMQDVRAAWPSDLPRGVIHADLFPDNALFVGERLTGVIDFYFACTDFLAYDLAVCLNAWCFEGEREYSAERAHAMIAAYEAARPLNADEHAALPVLAHGAALRFFATRLADWSAPPDGAAVTPKDPMEYAQKLAHWRDVRGVTDQASAPPKIAGRSVGAAVGSAWLGWLVSSLILFAVFRMLEAQSTHPWASDVTAIALVIILGSLPNALVAGTAIGVWWHTYASKRGWRRRLHYWWPGTLLGLGVGGILSALTLTSFGVGWWLWALISTSYAAVCGGVAGLCLWLWLRPDRDGQPNPPTSPS